MKKLVCGKERMVVVVVELYKLQKLFLDVLFLINKCLLKKGPWRSCNLSLVNLLNRRKTPKPSLNLFKYLLCSNTSRRGGVIC